MKRQLLVLLMLCSILCHAQTEVPGSYPAVSTDWLEARELEQFDEYELSLMRNEVFARYGYIFKKEELREYFSDKTWYKPQFKDVNVVLAKLTDIERHNIDLIQAREARLRPIAFKKLTRLELPLDLERGAYSDYYRVSGISPNSSRGDAVGIVGVLPDTSKYFAVLWYINELAIAGPEPRSYFITTYTKKLKQIAVTCVSLPIGGIIEFGASDCNNEDVSHSSYINSDLTYESVYTWIETCPGEDKPNTVKLEVSGRINRDGTVTVLRDNNPHR